MNYRHAYHAGNHADVLKHVILARVIERLAAKDKPFCVIDAFAGTGTYDLAAAEPARTREWETGIGRLTETFTAEVEALLRPYRAAVAASNPSGGCSIYPGSPAIAACLMRRHDRLIANELHPEDHDRLARHFLHDPRVAVTAMDAAHCIKAHLPPPERRGVILIDPPYEGKDEAQRAVRMLMQGLRRFATGIFMVWYPLKAGGPAEEMASSVGAKTALPVLRAELRVREEFLGGGLAGSGLFIVNPPWQLDADLLVLLPALAQRLGLGDWGQGRADWVKVPS